MKPKLFLGILLIFTILYQLFYQNIKEGVCNYNDDTVVDSNGNVIKRNSVSCQEAGIYTNNNNLKDVETKLNELKTIAANTQKNININSNSIKKNKQNAIRLGNAVVSDGKEKKAEEGGHCKKYPSACKDQAPFPTPITANEYNNIYG
tara:strand:- start:542 stop:985 length:444 start_codon:yes stop_codon:yes gene_type:complete